ncbi:DUF5719 family protein [Kribbella deserti]|uniref:DUF5719 family protein n=1 Tax=Kribbella deserti TaxID=1926257 RepID=A0ABV6QPU5_9ACTN
MNRLLTDPRLRVGLCAVILVVVALLGFVAGPPAAKTGTGGAALNGKAVVSRATVACPVLGPGGKVQSVVTAVSPLLPDGTPMPAGKQTALTLSDLDPDSGRVYTSVRERGQLGELKRTDNGEIVSVRANGPLAAGAAATVTARADEGANRGLASSPCVAPTSDFWFVGVSSQAGRRGVLTLTNLDEEPASVDVYVHGAEGEVEVPEAKGVVVPARDSTDVYLSTVLPNSRDLALHVQVGAGRVAATFRDNAQGKTGPAGVDWIPAAGTPTKQVVVPAIAPGKGLRVLTVINPGDVQATATLTLHGPNGRFKPARKETLDIPAKATRVVRLDDALKGDGGGVSITSDQPLAASARMIDAKQTDFAATASALPLTGPAYLALPAHPEPLLLMLTAPDKGGAVLVEVRDSAGTVVQTRELDIAEGATSMVALKPLTRSSYLTVTPRKGDLVAGVALAPPLKTIPPVSKVTAWTLATSLVFRAQLGAAPNVQSALR